MPEFSYQAFSAKSHSFAYILDRRRIVLVRFCGKISKMLWKNFQGHSLVNRRTQFSIGIGMPISQLVFSFSILSNSSLSHSFSLSFYCVLWLFPRSQLSLAISVLFWRSPFGWDLLYSHLPASFSLLFRLWTMMVKEGLEVFQVLGRWFDRPKDGCCEKEKKKKRKEELEMEVGDKEKIFHSL